MHSFPAEGGLFANIDALHVDLSKLFTIDAQGIACYINVNSQACKGPDRGVLLSEFIERPNLVNRAERSRKAASVASLEPISM